LGALAERFHPHAQRYDHGGGRAIGGVAHASEHGAAVLTQVLIARYFGRRAFGAISNVPYPFTKAVRLGRVVCRHWLRLRG